MNTAETEEVLLSDEEFEALEAVLVSDDVPADCMNLEMLDGYVAALVCSPERIAMARWLPAVWSADAETADFGSGGAARRALELVLRYYNEVVATLAAEHDPWEPFCYAPEGEDAPPLGDEWVAGFEQGVELWPDDWNAGLDSQDVAVAEGLLANVFKHWGAENAADADDETRLGWLAESAQAARGLFALWREVGLPEPLPADISEPATVARAAAGRNDLCPCGSGKKYKVCCGAEN
ncbi:MAG: UPF0149 family protein [Rhodocyclaceae bacterium]|nr:UPF0149 family protein [Rhodocyclaceae bacterium]MCP5235967.1 UPF0149 family protein [Zoogloeaceae bacterium]